MGSARRLAFTSTENVVQCQLERADRTDGQKRDTVGSNEDLAMLAFPWEA